ncbi:CLUMA_CG003787, isoform A [Clunio marinus]|uniref:CLUMA_CG003787, isoform A n=1 Tax=Clunio marinus TaxID=568069 RepID=A0A1J1HRQ1_9DIPT|nr:CLUMA_CG003787, isoform A [Clunio marinus]
MRVMLGHEDGWLCECLEEFENVRKPNENRGKKQFCNKSSHQIFLFMKYAGNLQSFRVFAPHVLKLNLVCVYSDYELGGVDLGCFKRNSSEKHTDP